MGQRLRTILHFPGFCVHARREYNFTCLTSPPPSHPSYRVENYYLQFLLTILLGEEVEQSCDAFIKGNLTSALITKARDLFPCTAYLYELTLNFFLQLLYICVTRNTSVTKKPNVIWGSVTVKGIQQGMESSAEVSFWKTAMKRTHARDQTRRDEVKTYIQFFGPKSLDYWSLYIKRVFQA